MQRILAFIQGEPVGFWTTLAAAILGLAAQLGLPVTQDVKNEVLIVIGGVYAITGLIMRQSVSPKGSSTPAS